MFRFHAADIRMLKYFNVSSMRTLIYISALVSSFKFNLVPRLFSFQSLGTRLLSNYASFSNTLFVSITYN